MLKKGNVSLLASILIMAVLYSLLGATTPTPQTISIKIEPLPADNTLSMQSANCIIQDQQGFIWIGTQDGLNKYDGYHFTIYNHELYEPETLSDNFILALCPDREGNIWVGTRSGGLNKFDRRTERFKHFRHDPNNPKSISSDYISTIFEDRTGVLWVGTFRNGLNRMDSKDGSFTRFIHEPDNPETISGYSVLSFCQDRAGIIWIGCTGSGLTRFDPNTGQFKRCLNTNSQSSDKRHYVWSIWEDNDSTLWLGTSNGLEHYFPNENKFVQYKPFPNAPPDTAVNIIKTVCSDMKGHLWCGTGTVNAVGNGIRVFDKKSLTFHSNLKLKVSSGSLNNTSVTDIMRDRTGSLWIGTTREGVYKYTPFTNKFACSRKTRDGRCTCLVKGKSVWALCEDRKGNLWVGTEDGGLNHFDRQMGKVSNYSHDPANSDSLCNNSIRAIIEDSSGFMWIGTDGGLDRFDTVKGKFKHHTHQLSNPGSLSDNRVSFLLEDHVGQLWVGTWGGGINKTIPSINQQPKQAPYPTPGSDSYAFSRSDQEDISFIRYQHIPGDPSSISSNKIVFIYQDRRNHLWLGTASAGLNRFNPDTGTFTRFKHIKGDRESLTSDNVMCAYECKPETKNDPHSKRTLWIGTWGGGLNKMDIETGKFTYYSRSNGLAVNSVCGLLGDDYGNLWISTNKGIAKFNIKTETFTNYSESHGLQSNEFNQGAFHKGRSGKLYFGGTAGLNCFSPSGITQNKQIPPIVITDFKIYGKSIKQYATPPTYIDINNETAIRLNYKQNHITFQFAALDYTNPGNNRYAYMLEGLDQDWIYCGTRRYATYTNLDGGTYTFRVKGTNSDGIWNETGTAVNVDIIPAFWNTLWFQISIIFILALSIFLPLYLRAKRFRVEIKHREQSEKVLKQSMAEFRKARDLLEWRHAEVLKLVSSISSIFIAVDAKGTIYQWNEPAERFFKLSHSEVMQKKFTECLAHCMKQKDLNAILETNPHTSDTKKMEVDVMLPDSKRILSIIVNPILDTFGRQRGLLLLCDDVTRRKTEEIRKNLFLKLQAIGQMHAGISHEINTPIQYIQINSRIISNFFARLVKFNDKFKEKLGGMQKIESLLDESGLDSTLSGGLEATQLIEHGLQQVMEVTKAMKEFFHPGHDHKELRNINELIKSTLIVSRYHIRKYAKIELELQKDLPLTLCFPARLNQVFLNIITNAVDAVRETGEWGRIIIGTKREENEIIIWIGDSGSGISDANASKIFDPFFTTKDEGIGTGLGLSMARKIIEENHEGKIYFESSDKNGTTFYIHIPLIQEDQRGMIS